jgi:arabinogalactan oligomer/maltooligosaccharide transport system permease protein
MSDPATLRRRLTAGLALAVALGVGLCHWVLLRTRAQEEHSRNVRVAVVELRALTEVVTRAGGAGDGARRAAVGFAAQQGDLATARVIAGVSLEASTAPEDAGDKAAPRRLSKDEKALYDLGQRLRAAIDTNRKEGAARKGEIEVAPTAAGGLTLAEPLEKDGAVVGFVQLETRPLPRAAATGVLLLLAAVVVPLLLFFVLSGLLGERKLLLAALATVLLLGTVALYGHFVFTTVSADRRATEQAVGAAVTAQIARAGAALEELSLAEPAPLTPAGWDVDVYRQPLGLIGPTGAVDGAAVERGLAAVGMHLRTVVAAFGVLALIALAFVGFGSAARLGETLRRHRSAYYYVFPAFFGMILLVFLPFLYGVALSFTDFSLYTAQSPLADVWVGVKNFVDILGDFHIARSTPDGLSWNYQNIYWTLGITVIWTVSNVAYGVGMGLFLALILNTKKLLARPIYRVLFVLPWAMPNYITALIWKGMFHQQFGVINQMIQMFGGTPVSWFEKPATSLFACIATNAWLSVPFMMVISLGALQSIPADLYEAARVDGATRWQQFRAITLPSLKPALIPAVILSVIWTFNMFNIIYLVSAGEPAHSTEILITQAYKFAFEQYRYGYAAAYSMVIFAILLLYGTWQNRFTKATEGI